MKGTLIQFLKNCPLTDKNNEVLLEVVLSVMMLSKEEITELNDVRRRSRSSSVTHSVNNEEDLRDKTKKGIFNMFKKKESSVVRKPTNLDQSRSPIRAPIARR